jgi:hypothetical protein
MYVSTDVETDGPIPGGNSLLSFGSAAFRTDGTMVGTYTANLATLPEATADPDTMAWWSPLARHAPRRELPLRPVTDGGATVVMLPHGMETTEGQRSLVVVPTEVDQTRYRHARAWLDQAVHELPAGVLWGVDGATPAQCAEMLDDLDDFARVCARLGLHDHSEFIEACRWHFDHCPHYLGRSRHFVDYETYIRDRRGPMQVPPPPSPDWLRRR